MLRILAACFAAALAACATAPAAEELHEVAPGVSLFGASIGGLTSEPARSQIPDSPLGTRWMGLSMPGVGIHGTDEPTSSGYSASHGCIRMHVPDAEWLFGRVATGTPVVIV